MKPEKSSSGKVVQGHWRAGSWAEALDKWRKKGHITTLCVYPAMMCLTNAS